MSAPVPREQRGVALLTVLLLVTLLSAVAVAVLSDIGRSTRLETQASLRQQAVWLAEGAVNYALVRADGLRDQIADGALAQGPVSLSFPTDTGQIDVVIRDGQACFNLNGLAVGVGDIWEPEPFARLQFVALAEASGLAPGEAEGLAGRVQDWLTGGGTFGARLAADGAYEGLEPGYGVGAQPLAEPSELRAVAGVSPEHYAALRPHVCTLPQGRARGVSVNGLQPEHAPVLVALTSGKLTGADAAKILSDKPITGWDSTGAFWTEPALLALGPTPEMMEATTTSPTVFEVTVRVQHHTAEVWQSATLVDEGNRFRVAARRWTINE
jgi:general secretion pathway protein K